MMARLWRHSTCPTFYRSYTSHADNTLVYIPKSNVYRFGDSNAATPVFRDVDWTVKEGQSWAVIGRGPNQKTDLLQTLCGHLRISPLPSRGLFPFLSDPPRDAYDVISLVSFAHRPTSAGSAFYDYTARYGAVREEDRITLRESMFGEYDFLNLRPKGRVQKSPEELATDKAKEAIFDDLSAKLGLSSLLDLPLVALSNGQTRRARIIKAILAQPEMLLLDEPLTGVDAHGRPTLLSVLQSLHEARRPRIILGLRMQDPIPDWITHLALVSNGKVLTGTKADILEEMALYKAQEEHVVLGGATPVKQDKEPIVEMRNVSVSYGERKVLRSINWTIRPGQRWHLQGANGSGKTTLLSLLTGDHPQSYTQRGTAHLALFSRPRQHISTLDLAARIGVVSPELANAYPRRAHTTVWDVVHTGFDSTFVPGVATSEDEQRRRADRMRAILAALGLDEAFARRAFVDVSPGEQSMVLLMRALVGRPPLVILDEVWAGMDERMVRAARRYLREGGVGPDQAVVVVSHWEEEVPWTTQDGLLRFRLQDGIGMQA